MGEIQTFEGRCLTCLNYTYNNVINVTAKIKDCKDCPKNGVCFGSHKLGPLKGYWKLRNDTDKIHLCPLP